MASQKLSELTAVTSTADESLVYVADTQDAGSTFTGRKITVSNLLSGLDPLTGGDGVDVTAGVASVDIEPAADYSTLTVANSTNSAFDGTYTAAATHYEETAGDWTAGTHALYLKDGDAERLIYWTNTTNNWVMVHKSGGSYPGDIVEGNTVVPVGSWTASEVLTNQSDTGFIVDGSYNVPEASADATYAAGGGGYLEFVGGQLSVKALDEDNLVSNSDLHVPTQQSVKAYVDAQGTLKADLVGGVIPNSQLPSLAITEYLGDVADEAAMLATSGQRGDWVTRQDTGTTFIQITDDGSLAGNWVEIATPTAPVSSVNGNTGTVVLDKTDIGLSNVDNTSDLDKPISTATQSALDLKAADADVLKKDGSVTLTGDLPAGGNTVTGLAAPLAGSDAATKAYVDSATSGQGAFFETVRVEAVGNIADFSTEGLSIQDGIQLLEGDRVLVEAQTNTEENGIYEARAAGWVRTSDADEVSEFVLNKTVYVSEGATHAGDVYALTTVPTTLGTDPVVFTKKQDSAGIPDGSITTVKLAADAVTVDKIADGINVNHFDASTTPDAEPATFYFLAVDAATGEIKVLDKSFVEID